MSAFQRGSDRQEQWDANVNYAVSTLETDDRHEIPGHSRALWEPHGIPRPSRRYLPDATLFRCQQHGVREAAAVGRVADDLAGAVDSQSIGECEAGVGGNERVEIDQRAIAHDERHVLARNGRLVAHLSEDRSANDLACEIDPGRLGSNSTRKRAQVGPDAVAVDGSVAASAEVDRTDDLAVVVDGRCAWTRRADRALPSRIVRRPRESILAAPCSTRADRTADELPRS